MKNHYLTLFFAVFHAFILIGQPNHIRPDGGGEVDLLPSQDNCLSPQDRRIIKTRLAANVAMLTKQGLINHSSGRDLLTVNFGFPLAEAPANTFYNSYYVTGYVDHDPTYSGSQYGSTNEDYNCGNRTYDTDEGYNHQGIDYATWPFPWYQYENDLVYVVAGAAGTIIGKDDGNDDDHCECSGTWNAVYIKHADGSEAWYGHLKRSSLTAKGVGDAVSEGEYLGVVASSGCSTGPNLHFEVYDSGDNLIDPYGGPCNSMNGNNSWWSSQPSYIEPAINALLTHDAEPVHGCPTSDESPNIETTFVAGSIIYFASYYRDQQNGDVTAFRVRKPDNSLWQDWTSTSSATYRSSWWYWYWTLPSDGPYGTWTFEADYEGDTYSTTFELVAAFPVEFITFSAKAYRATEALLEWTTATELNNAGFEVQRSPDGSTWEILGFVEGHGTTEEEQYYRFIDSKPFQSTNYYRLKQSDYDGESKYSSIEKVIMNKPKGEITVYPNPVNNEITLLGDETIESVKIFDAIGRLSLQSQGLSTINLSSLASGIYFLQVETDTEVYTEKLIKQ